MKINNTKNEFLKQQFLIIPEAKTFFNNILDISTELVKLHHFHVASNYPAFLKYMKVAEAFL